MQKGYGIKGILSDNKNYAVALFSEMAVDTLDLVTVNKPELITIARHAWFSPCI